MKIVQVSNDVVRDNSIKNLGNPNLYRILVCDDGNYGHRHLTARLKPIKNLTMDELTASFDDKNTAFIEVIMEDEQK